ncbi:MAG: N-acetyltransferase [Dehalococcoidia bacterium]|nr:N-acetyltransferase [Dehalococcoidia bacterium]
MITIRPETAEDYAAIREVTLLAFGQEKEARLVEDLRHLSDFIPELSLVAVRAEHVIGHILFSPMVIETEKGEVPALSLAPMSVRPECQNEGVGSQLVREGLKRCRSLGHEVVVVVGHPDYYPRFGFSSARAKRLEAPFEVPDEAFLVLELTPGALAGIAGVIKYPPPYNI